MEMFQNNGMSASKGRRDERACSRRAEKYKDRSLTRKASTKTHKRDIAVMHACESRREGERKVCLYMFF